MKIPRFKLLDLFIAPVLLAGWHPAAASAASLQLTIPATQELLRVRVRVPADVNLDEAKNRQLIEIPGGTAPIPADIFTAASDDGAPSPNARDLVASIPARPGADGQRQFRLIAASASVAAIAPVFQFREVSDKSLGLWEGDRPVFVYNFGIMSKPGVPSDRNRGTYLHPMFGLDGEVLTDDFPKDHYHHRGLFWAWPHVRIGARNYDLWDLRGIEQRFERWIERRVGTAGAQLAVENGWFIGDRKVMREHAWFTVYRAVNGSRAVDVDLIYIPTSEAIGLSGAEEKSYGGLTVRFAPRTDTVITTPLGDGPEDLAMKPLSWADLSARFDGSSDPSGAAIFISPNHPDFPPTWLTRHYGALCVGWPGVKPITFEPGQVIRTSYRVWIHRRAAAEAGVQAAYQSYGTGLKATLSE